MTATVIWIPFRGDGGWRSANFEAVYAQAASLGYPVVVEDSGDEPFSIARTWNRCAAARPWDVAIRWAADFLLVDPTTVHAAVAAGHHYTFAFDTVSTLDERQTVEVHRHGPRSFKRSKLPFGGINVVTRTMWEDVGGFDPRFFGWGHEDRAFVHAVEVLHGPRRRVPGHMLNLWHPKRTDVPTDPYFTRQEANLALWREYQSIVEPDKLRAFLAAR